MKSKDSAFRNIAVEKKEIRTEYKRRERDSLSLILF